LPLSGLIGSLALPFLIHNWMLTAIILLFWGGSVAGLYTVGLAHLGDKLHGSPTWRLPTLLSYSVTHWACWWVLRPSEWRWM
jgi:hypothetical protein